MIPTYNYNVLPLVSSLHGQLVTLAIDFEILVMDDGSPNPPPENDAINHLDGACYQKLERNMGRSGVRNLLARTARHELLLFLDADTAIIRQDFVKTYLQAVDEKSEIIYGGIQYQPAPPAVDQRLRWVYGNKREALTVAERNEQPHLRFLTLNFLIKKNVFERIRFNESIPNLRHEDTLFALDAKKQHVRIQHIDNPVMHLGLESSAVFLRKSKEACDALLLLVKEKLIEADQTSLSRFAQRYESTIVDAFSRWFYSSFEKRMERQLLSARPSLLIFDLYRLGYYLTKSRS